MAEYKVPQNVEADDKLIGPFSFRQFCYLMIAFGGCVMAFFLGKQALPLAIIPAPAVILFGALALPLRKDQPMEIYLAALVRYYILKPKVRTWIADGEGPNVKIGAPVSEDDIKTKDLKPEEVSQRLSFLANLTDTQGWSTRGLDAPRINHNLNEDFMASTADARDIMDENDSNAEHIDDLLDKSARKTRSKAINKMKKLEKLHPAPHQEPQASQVTMAAPTYLSTPVQPLAPAPQLSVNQLPNYNYQQPVQAKSDNSQVNGAQLMETYNAPEPAVTTEPVMETPSKPIESIKPTEPVKTEPKILPNRSDSDIIKTGITSSSDDAIDIKLH